MAHYTGTFYGFVNYVLETPAMPYIAPAIPVAMPYVYPVAHPGNFGWGPRKLFEKIRINWVVFEELDPGFIYHTFSGFAPDDFPDDFIDFGLTSRIIVLLAWDNPVDIIFNLYKNDDLVNFDEDWGFVELIPGKGFKIRNSRPGNTARYQLTVIN